MERKKYEDSHIGYCILIHIKEFMFVRLDYELKLF